MDAPRKNTLDSLITPGRWFWTEAQDSGDMPSLVNGSGEEVCNFGDSAQYYPSCGRDPKAADAALIAAAPDLLAALKALLDSYWTGADNKIDIRSLIDAEKVILRAEGGAK